MDKFCRQSRASVYELRDHFTTALDAGYISNEEFARLEKQAMSVIKLLNGYLRSTKNRKEVTRGKTDNRPFAEKVKQYFK